MRYVLTTLNARYTHSSLAIRYLAAYARRYAGVEVRTLEFNINQPLMQIFDSILEQTPSFVGFATYIWNVEMTLRIARMLKRTLPGTLVVLGGPEVSFDPEELLSSVEEIDAIVRGEGEETICEILSAVKEAKAAGQNDASEVIRRLQGAPGLTLRGADGRPRSTGDRPHIKDLDTIPNPYSSGYDELHGRIVYYESSRGCPFSCGYCLSSLTEGVRFFPLTRVLCDLGDMVRTRVLQVKFVDRTFNCDAARARQIWQHAIALSPSEPPYPTTFHFEVGADLLTDEDLDLLEAAPPGLFQFEVGVQTTNPQSLQAVSRGADLDKLSHAVSRLVHSGRVKVNLDLISGLPFDTYVTFSHALDYALGLRPHGVHIGLLKALKGSRVRAKAEVFGLIHSPSAPYEVLRTPTFPAKKLAEIRRLEEMVDLYYNSRRFEGCINLCLAMWDKPSDLFGGLASYWERHGFSDTNHRVEVLFEVLTSFVSECRPDISEVLADLARFDRLRQGLPAAGSHPPERDTVRRFVPSLADLPAREMSKQVAAAEFTFDVVSIHRSSSVTQVHSIIAKPRNTQVLFVHTNRSQGGGQCTIVECRPETPNQV